MTSSHTKQKETRAINKDRRKSKHKKKQSKGHTSKQSTSNNNPPKRGRRLMEDTDTDKSVSFLAMIKMTGN